MVFDPFDRFTPQDFVFKIARTPQEVEGFWALRRAIFCEEQKIFRGSDRDEVDRFAIPIIGSTHALIRAKTTSRSGSSRLATA